MAQQSSPADKGGEKNDKAKGEDKSRAAQPAAAEPASAAAAGDDKQPEGKSEGKAPDGAGEKRALYHVVGPGRVLFRGRQYKARQELELTEAEAASLGEAVARGPAPPPDVPVAERKGGRYQVVGPGKLWHEGKLRGPGYQLDLSEEEAKRLGPAVAPIRK